MKEVDCYAQNQNEESCGKTVQGYGNRKTEKIQGIQEPYLDKKVHEEEKEFKASYNDRRHKHKKHEESIAVSVKSGCFEGGSRNGKN